MFCPSPKRTKIRFFRLLLVHNWQLLQPPISLPTHCFLYLKNSSIVRSQESARSSTLPNNTFGCISGWKWPSSTSTGRALSNWDHFSYQMAPPSKRPLYGTICKFFWIFDRSACGVLLCNCLQNKLTLNNVIQSLTVFLQKKNRYNNFSLVHLYKSLLYLKIGQMDKGLRLQTSSVH